jgi:hypothetical protein
METDLLDRLFGGISKVGLVCSEKPNDPPGKPAAFVYNNLCTTTRP